MDRSMYTDAELELTRERNLKYQGTAKINIDRIISHPSISRELDPANVERLSEIFNRDGCRRLDVRNHITAIVSRQHLNVALHSARFPTGDVQCLHGQHRLRAAAELLSPSDQWWTVDLYLDDISPNLLATLIDEYSNEKAPSDGEVYRKVRQYEHEANAYFKKRWMARLSSNKIKRLRQLESHDDVCAAFDGLLAIPALLVHGLQLGSLPDILATNCDEEMVHSLIHLREYWSSLMGNNREKLLKIDVHTIQALQLLAPGVSTKDRTTAKGLVLSGAVFSNFTQTERSSIWEKMKNKDTVIPSLYAFFQNMRYLESCADCIKRLVTFSRNRSTVKSAMRGIFKPADPESGEYLVQTSESGFRRSLEPQVDHAELGYQQLWLYAMRHYPNLAKEPKSGDRVAKPSCEKADETALYDMAVLAQKLGFDSPQIKELISQSPDRQIARAALLKARKPDRYRYHGDSFESLISTIVGCFSRAVSVDYQGPREHIDGREVRLDARCGRPHAKAQQQDRQFLFIDPLHTDEFQTGGKISSLFIRRYVYFSFFGKPQTRSVRAANGRLEPGAPLSPLFVPSADSRTPQRLLPTDEVEEWMDLDRSEPVHHGGNEEVAEQERQAREAAVRAEQERQAREAAERAEQERQVREAAERAEQERLAREAAERAEQERQAREAAERAEQEQQAREAAERAEQERQAREAEVRAEQERQAQEAERAEQERQAQEAAERAEQERRAQEHAERPAAEQAEQERPPTREILTSVSPANQGTTAKATRKERSPRRATQVDFAAAQQPGERQMPNPRPLEAISEDVAPQIHGSIADIPATESNEDVSQPPPLTKGGTSSQEEHALLAEGRAEQEQQEDLDGNDAAEHVDEFIEMLQNQAEHRALGEPRADNGSHLETEPSRDEQEGRGRVAQEREIALTQLQARSASGATEQRQQKPEQKPESSKVRKSQKTKPMARTANRAAMRTAAVGIELDGNVDSPRSAELAAVPEAESTADGTPVPSEADVAARQDQSNRPARELTETPPAPLRIKKNKEKVKRQGPYARPAATSEKPLPGQHRRRDGPRERGTQIDFTRVIENSRAGLPQDNLQYTSSAPHEVPSSAEGIRILFKARNEHGEWEKVIHNLVVDPANPSSVERVAKEDARNQKATFYDKDLRIITPAQCFDAAIEDEVNTIFVTYREELSVNEETVAAVSRSLDRDRDRAKQHRG